MPHHNRARTRPLVATLFLIALGAGLSGCATTATVKVDAMANPNAPGGYAYTFAGGKSGRASGDVRQDSVAEHVRLALSQRGMYEAPSPADADVVVEFEFGEHAPQTHVTTTSEPTIVGPGQIIPGANTVSGGPSISIGPGAGQGNYPNSVVNNSNTNQVVMVQTTRVTTTTEKYIRISARENPQAKTRPRNAPPPQQVWTVEATVEDESTDFNKALPPMIDAAIDYIGVNTGGQQKVVVKVDS